LDILTFVDTAKVKFGSLKVWDWIVQSYKITPCYQSTTFKYGQPYVVMCQPLNG